jgi:hypothetical protein
MKNNTKKKIDKLLFKIRVGLSHVDSQMAKGLDVHMQRITEVQCDVEKLDKILWKAQKDTL